MTRRRKVSEFQLADELTAVLVKHYGRRFARLAPEQRRALNDRCLELARIAANLEPSEPRT